MELEKKKDVVVELAGLLRRINEGKNPQSLRKEASRLIGCIHPKDITLAESELIKVGFTAQRVQQLSSAFILMGVLEGRKTDLYRQLPQGHVLKKVLAEHEMLRCFLSDLEDLVKTISKMDAMSETNSDFRRLAHVIEHLNAMEEHMDRESDVIFPFLKSAGWESLCRSVESDHVYLRIALKDLVKLIVNYRSVRFDVFKTQLSSLAKYIIPGLKEHLFHEDCVLYPLAVELVTDPKAWQRLKKVCDDIDYCGLHI